MKLILATHNQHKIEEIQKILSQSTEYDLARSRDLTSTNIAAQKLEILTLKDFPNVPEVEETGKTMQENAIIKAVAVYNATGIPALADDSGLEVDALNGAPGVVSARFAGPGCTYKDNNVKLLGLLKGIPEEKRGAAFRCVVALALSQDDVRIVEGKVKGIITDKEIGKNGFGYDPVFYDTELGKTFAQLSQEEKNRVSHRGIAFRKAKELIKRLMTDNE
ncbi:MAG: RdgB/HAM1 family non-canonical purine NTP pyrophosphatase [candidate division Zixibacteria bacterium]|nr:RdgB/HAM1 family non-canonical purine NTP pyrophosphatase [candidate division Zixibacteria bacterium]